MHMKTVKNAFKIFLFHLKKNIYYIYLPTYSLKNNNYEKIKKDN